MDGYGLNLTIKGDGGAPWLTVSAATAAELEDKLDGVKPALLEKGAEIGNHLTGVVNASKLAAVASGAPAQTQAEAAPQAAAAPVQTAWSAPAAQAQPAGSINGVRDPMGRLCPACNAGIIGKEIARKSDGKVFKSWTCPNQKAKNDGHFHAWAD